MKVVINVRYGGFSLSDKAMRLYIQYKFPYAEFITETPTNWGGNNFYVNDKHLYSGDIERDDECLIKVVEILGDLANGQCAKLLVVEIPDDVKWQVEGYDGFEHIAEQHRTWN